MAVFQKDGLFIVEFTLSVLPCLNKQTSSKGFSPFHGTALPVRNDPVRSLCGSAMAGNQVCPRRILGRLRVQVWVKLGQVDSGDAKLPRRFHHPARCAPRLCEYVLDKAT